MCTRMYCDATGDEISSIRDLGPYVTDDFIVLHDAVTETGESKEDALGKLRDMCLCPVNLPASFEGNARWRIMPDDRFLGDWLIVSTARSPLPLDKEGS